MASNAIVYRSSGSYLPHMAHHSLSSLEPGMAHRVSSPRTRQAASTTQQTKIQYSIHVIPYYTDYTSLINQRAPESYTETITLYGVHTGTYFNPGVKSQEATISRPHTFGVRPSHTYICTHPPITRATETRSPRLHRNTATQKKPQTPAHRCGRDTNTNTITTSLAATPRRSPPRIRPAPPRPHSRILRPSSAFSLLPSPSSSSFSASA